jgi:hypothetical protein
MHFRKALTPQYIENLHTLERYSMAVTMTVTMTVTAS